MFALVWALNLSGSKEEPINMRCPKISCLTPLASRTHSAVSISIWIVGLFLFAGIALASDAPATSPHPQTSCDANINVKMTPDGCFPPLVPQFIAAQSTVATGSSLLYPYRVAVDSQGNVYISDTQNNRALKETLSHGVYTETVLGSGMSTPYGIAVDSSQNVYIVDNGNVRVLVETLSAGTYTQSVLTTSTLSYPTAIAIDASGNLYIADTGHVRILKELKSGNSYTESVVSSSGLPQPVGLAVDSSGDLFVSDIDDMAIFEETPSDGSYVQSTVSTTGLNYPYDITVDANGNLYIADFGNDRIVKLTNFDGSYTQSVYPTANLTGPLGLTGDAQGNLYIADTFGFSIKQLLSAGGNFGPVNVGSLAGPIYALFQFSGGAPSGTTTVSAVDIFTQGSPAPDFSDADSSTCSTSSTYSAGDFCAVSVSFSPQYPGGRYGAAELIGTSPNFQATGYLSGTGTAAMLSFFPGIPSQVAGPSDPFNLSNPFAAAVDAAGNVYIADYNNNAVYKETVSEGGYTQSTIATGLNNPEDVAVDGAGNVYIVDSGNNQVIKETWNGTTYQQATVAGVNFPTGVAVGNNGNFYVSSFSDGAVYLETFSKGAYLQSTVVGGLNQPRKIAVDASGNVYIANTGASTVLMETWTGSDYAETTIGSGMLFPYGVAVDASGSVYVADTVNHRILLESPSGETYIQYPLYPGATVPGITVGGDGSIYVPDPDTAAVYRLDLSPPPGLSFAASNFGVVSSDSPQTIELFNSGNAPLSLPAPNAGANPSVSANFNLDASTTCPAVTASSEPESLAAAGVCIYAINFLPVAIGEIEGSATLTDNAINATNGMQVISLSGTGVGGPVVSLAPTTLAFGNQTVSMTSASQPVVLTNTGNTSLAITTIGMTGTNSADFAQTNNCPATLAVSSQCTLHVTFTPSLAGAESAALQFTDNAADSPETAALSGMGVITSGYSMSANPASLTIAQGQSGSTTLTITPVGGFTGTLTFTCTDLPANSSCVFAPTQVVMSGDNTAATVALTVNTTGTNGIVSEVRPLAFPGTYGFSGTSARALAFFILPAGLLFLIPSWLPKKRRRYGYL
jgi:streptogramin lyase